MARYIYSEIHLLEIHLLKIHLLRDTSTPGDLWESQIPMTCSFIPLWCQIFPVKLTGFSSTSAKDSEPHHMV